GELVQADLEQVAIVVVCKDDDRYSFGACESFNDRETEICTKIERDFLRRLLGGCSTPISALAQMNNRNISFRGNILSLDGGDKVEIEKSSDIEDAGALGREAAEELLEKGGAEIAEN